RPPVRVLRDKSVPTFIAEDVPDREDVWVRDLLQPLVDIHLPPDGPFVLRLGFGCGHFYSHNGPCAGIDPLVDTREAAAPDLLKEIVMGQPLKNLDRGRAAAGARGAAAEEVEDDEVAGARGGVAAAAQVLQEAVLDRVA